jgi:hypothetical protein
MKTIFARRQELEGLVRAGKLRIVVARYIEICNEKIPIQKISAFLVDKIIECEQSAGLIGDEKNGTAGGAGSDGS